jgi:hypothetical protein
LRIFLSNQEFWKVGFPKHVSLGGRDIPSEKPNMRAAKMPVT